MNTLPVCPCDATGSAPRWNTPGMQQIAFRAGDFNSFRRALLTPLLSEPGQPGLEQALGAWQTAGTDPSVADLGVMMVEWWAYLCDILTFYNERIANEEYLRTAQLPETPAELIQVLGYRPRPGIGASGILAALVARSVRAGESVVLPQGLQIQSKPGPGKPPQTFELAATTTIGVPDQIAAMPSPTLLAVGAQSPVQYGLILQGSVAAVNSGDSLLLSARDASSTPLLITLSAPPRTQTASTGGKQTVLSFVSTNAPGRMTAADARLTRAGQSAPLWTINGSAFDGTGTLIQMAGLVRQIRPNDFLVFSAPGADPQLAQVRSTADVMGDISSAGSATTVSAGGTGKPTPIPVLHTQLTLAAGLASWLTSAGGPRVTVLFGWVDVGTLVDQPAGVWDGSGSLQAISPASFAAVSPTPLLLQDASGSGLAASGVGAGASLSVNWPATTPVPLSPGLQPLLNVLFNLLPVTRGKTVAKEIVGSGDASQAGQSFKLAKSPVTYLAAGAGYASTVSLTVNGLPWNEVKFFYGQSAIAQVFVTREDAGQNTWVDFGDGVNGARLPTGANNIVATYRTGSGADLPPAGKLTVLAQSYPGLQAVVNPVAVSGGSDPDSAGLLKRYAPRSVLAFGRVVSIFDYEALAAQAPGVTRASASWAWDAVNLRASVTVYVAGEANVATSVETLLAAAGDPNRPVRVLTATERSVTLTISFLVRAGMDQEAITAGLQSALFDPVEGLFSPQQMAIGEGMFDSRIEAACLAVAGVEAITFSSFAVAGMEDTGPLHLPGESGYFTLDPGDFHSTLEVSPND